MAKPTVLPEWDETEVNSVEPDATHKAEGWLAPAGVPEKPPYQSFNFWQNSVWKWLNEINIKGILGYDALTDYIADLSYVVGSDGNLYQCGINNGPSSSIVNPVGDVTGTWNDIINVTSPTARGYIDGLILSNDTDTDHDISMSIGICRNKTDTLPIQLIAAIVKQIDVNWAEGTNDGGFPSGLSLTLDTWYHFYIIMSADGTKVDAGFDTSLTATNLLADATDYSLYKRVGSVLTDGSSNIIEFNQYGDEFLWKNPPLDLNALALALNTSQTPTLSIPLGVKTLVNFNFYNSNTSQNRGLYFSSPDVDDETPVGPPTTAPQLTAMVPSPNVDLMVSMGGMIRAIRSNATSQIRVISNDASTLYLTTLGWIDPRGRDV